MKPSILFATLACAAPPAAATDWRPVVADVGTVIYLVDADRLSSESGKQPTARVLMVWAPGERQDGQAMEYDYTIDCVGNRARMETGLVFDEKGKSLTTPVRGDGNWLTIAPESGMQSVANVVCGKRKLSDTKVPGETPVVAARALIGQKPEE